MKKLMKHTETSVKRHLIHFLTLTVMLALLVPSAYASHSLNELRVSPNNMIAQNKTNKTEPFLISPVKDKPGDSGGDEKRWPGIYQIFGQDETNVLQDQVVAVKTNKPGGAGPLMPESYRWLGSNDTNDHLMAGKRPPPGKFSPTDEGSGKPSYPTLPISPIYRIFG